MMEHTDPQHADVSPTASPYLGHVVMTDRQGHQILHLSTDEAHQAATQLITAANQVRDEQARLHAPFLTRWVVTAVNGSALGSGTALVLAADADTARAATTEKVRDQSPLVDSRVEAVVTVTEVTPLERVVAAATLQVWVGNVAQEIPGGPVEFDVTMPVVAMGRDLALALADSTEDTDGLYLSHNPQAQGPLYVNVEDSIWEFFEQIPEDTLM